MAQLAIQLPALLPEVFPLLLAGRNGSLTFSQKQLACILANAFFGTLPDQKLQFRENGKSMRMFPHCDFRVLFQEWMYNSVTKAKLDGIFEYFHRVLDRPGWESSKVTFTRRCLSEHEFPDWDNLDTKFYDLKAQSSGRIEDDGVGCLQVDFANEIIGGGVLSQGAVQEEILFIIYPEMLASMLFSQQMMDNEAVFITGPERFSTYTGYAASFKIAGRFNDSTPFDSKGRRKTEFVAMDATYFRRKARKSQFGKDSMVRELNKAYTSFLFSYQSSLSGDASIATGNWGCGAFNGDLELKAVIQLLAASAARRNLIYFTFGDEDLSVKLATLSQMLLASKLTAGRLFHLVISFNDTRQENSSLLEFLITTIIEQ
ncbi:Poly glycohydrolase [Obelidium mucronatum]|nr:Poly glycohydrolase [Obelidium mucronatum]